MVKGDDSGEWRMENGAVVQGLRFLKSSPGRSFKGDLTDGNPENGQQRSKAWVRYHSKRNYRLDPVRCDDGVLVVVNHEVLQ